jgi:release factor glutamine methyltransferase
MSLTVGHLISQAQKLQLRTEMEIYMAHLMKVGRLDLLAHPDLVVPIELLAQLQSGLIELMKGRPVHFLTNEKEFYGIPFFVDERVLIPRGCTELLVDYVLEMAASGASILEIGVGSGAISIALKKTRPDLEILATDISAEALAVASQNAKAQNVAIEFFQSDLLQEVPVRNFDILVTNLPYIGEEKHRYITEEVEKHEPHLALFGGSDGLRLYERLFQEIVEQKREFQAICGEIGFSQGPELEAMAKRFFPNLAFELRQDLEGLDRHFFLTSDKIANEKTSS